MDDDVYSEFVAEMVKQMEIAYVHLEASCESQILFQERVDEARNFQTLEDLKMRMLDNTIRAYGGHPPYRKSGDGRWYRA